MGDTKRLCELCIDCDDVICEGRDCHKSGGKCIITDDCFTQCDAVGGFIGKIPIFDLPGIGAYLDDRVKHRE